MALKDEIADVLKQGFIGGFVGGVFAISLTAFYFAFKASDFQPEYLNVSLVALLVLITYIYARATEQIVKETRKDRKIQNIKERIENLYSPIKFHPSMLQVTRELLRDIKKKSYLASPDLQKLFGEYFRTIEEYGKEEQTRIGPMIDLQHDKQEFMDLRKRLEEQIDKDFNKLQDDLNKLYGK